MGKKQRNKRSVTFRNNSNNSSDNESVPTSGKQVARRQQPGDPPKSKRTRTSEENDMEVDVETSPSTQASTSKNSSPPSENNTNRVDPINADHPQQVINNVEPTSEKEISPPVDTT